MRWTLLFFYLLMSTEGKRRKKERKGSKAWRSGAFHSPPPQRSCVEEKRGGLGHVIGRACGHGSAPRQRERGLLHD